MKKIGKILLMMLLSFALMNVTFADEAAETGGGAGDAYTPPSVTPVLPGAASQLETRVTAILGVMQWIGFIIGIAMCIWIGIKYLTAGAGQKAEVKSTMIPWIIGAACIALAPTLATSIFNMFKGT